MWHTQTKTFDGEQFEFEIYSQDSDDTDILFVHHGASRSIYGSGSRSISAREDLTVFTPIFAGSDYGGDEYQRGGIVDGSDRVLPESEWTTRLEAPMVDWARAQVPGDGDVFLFGHSGGGQYLNRVAAYERPQDVARIVIANPSTWVLPTLEEDAPYGFDGLGTDAEERQALREYLALPMTIFLGGEDDDSGDPTMSTSSAAMEQGADRLERGINTFEMGQEVAETNGWAFNWDLVIAEGVGHSGSSMLRSPEMVEALRPVDLPVNSLPYDIVLTGAGVAEDATGGTVVGQLSGRDADGDELSFEVTGDPRFFVNGSDQLVVAAGADLSQGGAGTASLTVIARDGRGGVVEADADVVIRDTGASGENPIGEAGRVTFAQSSGAQWHSVTFEQKLDNPSVVMGGLTFNGTDSSTLRVRNVTDRGFEFQLDEWDHLDGWHKSETANWIAIEQGTHILANGLVVEAGSGTASGRKSEFDFDRDTFDTTPTVLAQVTSDNGSNAVTERLQDIGSTGFSLRLDREESRARGSHGTEDVDWIAMERGGSAGAGLLVGRTGDRVTHRGDKIDLGNGSLGDDYVFLADIQTRDGSDTANIRVASHERTGATAFVHEERSRDLEISHTTENVGYAGIDAGLIFSDLSF